MDLLVAASVALDAANDREVDSDGSVCHKGKDTFLIKCRRVVKMMISSVGSLVGGIFHVNDCSRKPIIGDCSVGNLAAALMARRHGETDSTHSTLSYMSATCRQRHPMSAKSADNVVCRRHVADMSPTFPTKVRSLHAMDDTCQQRPW